MVRSVELIPHTGSEPVAFVMPTRAKNGAQGRIRYLHHRIQNHALMAYVLYPEHWLMLTQAKLVRSSRCELELPGHKASLAYSLILQPQNISFGRALTVFGSDPYSLQSCPHSGHPQVLRSQRALHWSRIELRGSTAMRSSLKPMPNVFTP